MKIVAFKLIEEMEIRDLEKNVNDAIADGWQPHGNVVIHISTGNGRPFYVQSMIKHE